MDANELVVVEPVMEDRFATAELTFNGEQGVVNDPLRWDLSDASVVEMVQEALRSGAVTGITQDADADLTGYKVGRYPARPAEGLPNRFSLRPSTPFGGKDTVLVWQEIPETTSVYLIPDAPDWLAECHNCYINGHMTERQASLMDRVSDALCQSKQNCLNPSDELATTWAAFQQKGVVEISGGYRVVYCGFYV